MLVYQGDPPGGRRPPQPRTLHPGETAMNPVNRRTFLGAGALTTLPAASGRAWVSSPAERVRVAVLGIRSRGVDLAQSFAKAENAEVVAVCDIDESLFGKPVKAVQDA